MSDEEKKNEEVMKETPQNIQVELQGQMLARAYEEIDQLKRTNKQLLKRQMVLRDSVAIHIYGILIKEVTDYETAARDAYYAADKFMRYRETGDEIEPIMTH